MRVDLEHVVAHPLARVFTFMATPANRPLWQERTESVEVLTPGETRAGTRWREVTRGIGSVEMELVAFERDALWIEAGTTGAGKGRVRVEFSPGGDAATRLRVQVELNPRGAKRLLEPALGHMIRRQMPRDLEHLEELLDAGSADVPG